MIGTGIIGAIISYPVMTWIWGRTGLTWMFYVPSFTAGTLIGGSLAFVLLTRMKKAGLVAQIQSALGSDVYTGGNEVLNDAIGIAVLGFIGYLVTVVLVHKFVPEPGAAVNSIKYFVLAAFVAAGVLYWNLNKSRA